MNIALLQRSPTYTHPSNRKKRRLPGTPIHDFHEVYRRRRIQIVKDRIPLPRWADAHPTNPKPGSVGTPVGQTALFKAACIACVTASCGEIAIGKEELFS
jgi:hypothetical protein